MSATHVLYRSSSTGRWHLLCLMPTLPASSSTHPCLHAASTSSPPDLAHATPPSAWCLILPCLLSSVIPLVVCQILCFMHPFAMLSKEAPRVCPEALVSSISSVHLHWVQLQGLDYGLYVKAFLLSGIPVSEVITYFTYFKMLVCIRMDLKFKVEFYL